MCGLFCYFGETGVDLSKAMDVVRHRGPDSQGYLFFSASNNYSPDLNYMRSKEHGKKIAFGFTRLSIIDLHNQSNQPFSSLCNQYHIVFNGEIYNYLELSEKLKEKGFKFKTNSDTEILLASYIYWGEDCVNHFNGMWAFVIFDTLRKVLFISRDRFGVKPLFYSYSNNGIYFFSEIKQIFQCGIKKEINENIVRDYLESSILDAGRETFYKNIFRFPASHSASVSIDSQDYEIKPYRYFEINNNVDYNKIQYGEAVIEFTRLFQSSIKLRYRSDVPVGACLSGGLDSSSIVAMSALMGNDINAFTVDNRLKEISEIYYVNKLCEKYRNINLKITYNGENDIDKLDSVFEIQDEPISGLSVIAQMRVMELAKANKVVVLLDGQGSDEIFGGYKKYIFFYLKELFLKGDIRKLLFEAYYFYTKGDINLFELEGIRRYTNRTGVENYLSNYLLSLDRNFSINFKEFKDFKDLSYKDISLFSYPQLLRYEDRNSMAFSLESRMPFLDFRIVSMVYNLPTSYKINNGFTKILLRDSMKSILPDEIRLRHSKLGFAINEKQILFSSLNEYFHKYFSRMNNPYVMNKLLSQDFSRKIPKLDYRSYLRLYLFDRWYQKSFNE